MTLGAHDPLLVAVSILLAALASFTALDLAGRVRAAPDWTGYAWIAASAVVMGGGIWSMHFVGMLAYHVPGMEVGYDFELTIVSLLLPILITGLAFYLVSRPDSGRGTLAASGVAMGAGIVAMHYTGMAAMRMPATIHYAPGWVAVSIVIAVVAATAALWLAFRASAPREKLAAALAMGLAISGMHYAAMQGVAFDHGDASHAAGEGVFDQARLAFGVAGATFAILLMALIAAALDRRHVQALDREAEALRRSEERFRLLLRSVTDYAIFMLDRDGRVASWNAGAERIKGYAAEEIIGRRASRFYTPEDRSAGMFEKAIEEAAAKGRVEVEGWRVRKDGTRFWANVVIESIRDDAGDLVGFAKVTRDVTERWEAQQTLQQTQQALLQAQKMEALGQLTGGVAHDFNNLLTVVLGSMELLRNRCPDDPNLTRFIDAAIQAAERGATLTKRMLAFARRQDLRPTAVDVPELLRDMAELLQRAIGPTIRIETRFPLILPRVHVDGHQLEMALMNLVVNARDAMPDGGTIRIVAREEIETGPNPVDGDVARFVSLSVEDEGEGMDEATLARAREPFFTTKPVGKGTGLGLSMVHGLAEQSNGRLILESRKGEGTTAALWLPIAVGPVVDGAAEVPPPAGAASSRPLVVLCVDDDALVLASTSAMIRELGHTVVEATSGAEALEAMAAETALDVVVTDHAMPEMTGVELRALIRERRPRLPVLLVTGYAGGFSSETADALKIDKPLDSRSLAAAIANAIALSESQATVLPFRPRSA